MANMIECVGLPGIGKTTFFNRMIKPNHPNAQKVSTSGFDLPKALNLGRGAMHKPSILRIAVSDTIRRGDFTTFKRYLILLERIGRLTHSGGAAVDEGPLQAVWALFHTLDLSSENRKICETILSNLVFGQTIQYVCASSAIHKVFSSKRIRKHRYAAMLNSEKKMARSWMAIILCQARQNAQELKYHRVAGMD